jgi:hypothetical protein
MKKLVKRGRERKRNRQKLIAGCYNGKSSEIDLSLLALVTRVSFHYLKCYNKKMTFHSRR